MKTSFVNYLESIDNLNLEIAKLMVEMEVDPWNFILEYYKEDEELVKNLNNHKNLIDEGFFGNLGRAVSGAARTMGGWLGQAANSGMQSARAAGQVARDAMAGPEARYNGAISALGALSKELVRNPVVKQAAASDSRYKGLVGNLQGIMKQLQQQKDNVADLLKMSVNPGQAQGATTRLGPKMGPGDTATA